MIRLIVIKVTTSIEKLLKAFNKFLSPTFESRLQVRKSMANSGLCTGDFRHQTYGDKTYFQPHQQPRTVSLRLPKEPLLLDWYCIKRQCDQTI